jgi:tRNA (adenine57-N1/adenine58-N1)-methyltransferase
MIIINRLINDKQMAQDQMKQEQVIETPSVSSKQENEVDLIVKNTMWKSDELIQEGTLVILFENFNSITYCYVNRNQTFENRHGLFAHNDMIGKPFGTKIVSRKSKKGYMFLLAPTPELWSRALRHRTQIVFTLDASAIIFKTNLKPGARVIESGTGSGSLTTSLARTVAPHGHVYTFEFNKTRAEIAK